MRAHPHSLGDLNYELHPHKIQISLSPPSPNQPTNQPKTMLSLTLPHTPTRLPSLHRHHRPRYLPSIHSLAGSGPGRHPPTPPSPPPPNEIYQPFRPPPSPLPSKYLSLSPSDRLDILRNRLGLWHDYAPLISSLSRDGFTPPSIEDLTGISPIDQNRLAVASSVRLSLPPDLLPHFDSPSSPDLLYQLRLLSTSLRAAAARYLLLHGHTHDANFAIDLARAIKDFPRRRGDHGWDAFSADSPADCLAYTHFRASREAIAAPEKLSALEKAMATAETEPAKERIRREIEKVSGRGEGEEEEKLGEEVKLLQVVRLKYGEVAEAASVVVLPVSKAGDGAEGVKEAPEVCKWEGELGVVASEKGWGRWVVLPGWAPVMEIGGEGGVAVEFGSSRGLPWRVRRWEEEEGVVVVVDRKRNVVGGEEENGDAFYLVSGKRAEVEGGLRVERGSKLVEEDEEEVLGAVVLVVRPPKDEVDEMGDEDWD